MENGLNEIKAVQGVRGCFASDNEGEIFASAPPLGIEEEKLAEVSQHSLQALVEVAQVEQGMKELDLKMTGGTILVWDQEQYFLVVICDPDTNISLVRLSINVVTNQWKDDQSIQRRIENHHRVRAST